MDKYNEGFVGSSGYLWRKIQVEAIAKFIRAWVGTGVSGSKTSKEWVEDIDGRSTMVMQIGNARHPVILKVFPSNITGIDEESGIYNLDTDAYATVEDSYTSYYSEVGYTKKFSNYYSLGTRKDVDGDEHVESFLFTGDKVVARFVGAKGDTRKLQNVDVTNQKELQMSGSDEAVALSEWKSIAAYIRKRLEIWDEENYISRRVVDFENNPIIQELKDYFDVELGDRWELTTDDSLTKNRSEFIIHLDDTEDSDNSLSVKLKDIGGGNYLYYLDLHGSSPNNFDRAREYKNSRQLMSALRKKFGHTYRYNEVLGISSDSIEEVSDRLYKIVSRLDNRFVTNKFNKPSSQKDGVLVASKEVVTGEPLVSFLVRDTDIVLAISPYEKYNCNVFTTKPSWESEIVSNYANLTSDWRSGRKDEFLGFGRNSRDWERKSTSMVVPVVMQTLNLKGESSMIRRIARRRVNELRSTNISSNVRYPKEVFDRVVNLIGDALGDTHLRRNCIIDVRPRKDGTEKWDILLRNSNAQETISLVIDENGNIIQSNVASNLSDRPAPEVRLNNPKFVSWLSDVSSKFLDEYGAFNKASAKIKDNQYVDPDYDLANWSDRFLNRFEGDIIDLTNVYDIELEESSEEKDYKNGKLVFTGSYKDLANKMHDIEVRLFWSIGDKFKVWIRPDKKGSSDLKWDGQRTLSSLKDWIKSNVAKRGMEFDEKCKSRKVEYTSFDDSSVKDEIIDAIVEQMEDIFGQAEVIQDNGDIIVVDIDGDNHIAIKCVYRPNKHLIFLDGDFVGGVSERAWDRDPGDALEDLKDKVEEWIEDNFVE